MKGKGKGAESYSMGQGLEKVKGAERVDRDLTSQLGVLLRADDLAHRDELRVATDGEMDNVRDVSTHTLFVRC